MSFRWRIDYPHSLRTKRPQRQRPRALQGYWLLWVARVHSAMPFHFPPKHIRRSYSIPKPLSCALGQQWGCWTVTSVFNCAAWPNYSWMHFRMAEVPLNWVVNFGPDTRVYLWYSNRANDPQSFLQGTVMELRAYWLQSYIPLMPIAILYELMVYLMESPLMIQIHWVIKVACIQDEVDGKTVTRDSQFFVRVTCLKTWNFSQNCI